MERTSASTSSTSPNEVAAGRVVGAHGLRGWLRVRTFPDAGEALLRAPRVRIGRRESDPEARSLAVESVAPGRRGELRLALAGVANRDGAEALRGQLVLIPAQLLAPAEPGEYYGYELVGCRVEDADGAAVGRVREIWSTGATDVLVVEGEGGAQHLIPAAREMLREVDVEGRRIVVDLIPGLLDPA